MRKMRLFQTDAYISIDFSQGLSEVFRLVDEGDPSVTPTMMLGKIDQGSKKRVIVYEQPEVKEVNALKHELGLFVQSVLEGTEPPVTGRDGLQALEVAQEILKTISANTARLLGSNR
jgi:predicted dehydrogenase